MNNRGGLLTFITLVILFVFTIIIGNSGIDRVYLPWGLLALLGYIVGIGFAITLGSFARKNGESLALAYFAYAVVVSVVFVWFLTRCGTFFRLWT
jgi:hypothetical protein